MDIDGCVQSIVHYVHVPENLQREMGMGPRLEYAAYFNPELHNIQALLAQIGDLPTVERLILRIEHQDLAKWQAHLPLDFEINDVGHRLLVPPGCARKLVRWMLAARAKLIKESMTSVFCVAGAGVQQADGGSALQTNVSADGSAREGGPEEVSGNAGAEGDAGETASGGGGGGGGGGGAGGEREGPEGGGANIGGPEGGASEQRKGGVARNR